MIACLQFKKKNSTCLNILHFTLKIIINFKNLLQKFVQSYKLYCQFSVLEPNEKYGLSLYMGKLFMNSIKATYTNC